MWVWAPPCLQLVQQPRLHLAQRLVLSPPSHHGCLLWEGSAVLALSCQPQKGRACPEALSLYGLPFHLQLFMHPLQVPGASKEGHTHLGSNANPTINALCQPR